MIASDSQFANPPATQRFDVSAWLVAAILSLSLIGLLHDRQYAASSGAEIVEAGRGVEEKAVNQTGLGAAAAVRLVGFLLFLGIGCYCAATSRDEAHFRLDALTLLIALAILWAIASWVWSVERSVTARELFRLLVYIGVAAALARRFDPRTLCFVLATALSGSVFTAIAFEIGTGGFQLWHADYRLTGTLHSNMLAVQGTFVALVAYAFAMRGARFNTLLWALFLAAVSVVFFTKTRTALGTVIAGIVAMHVVCRPAREWLYVSTSFATLLAGMFLGATALGLWDSQIIESIANLGRRDDLSQLTGRVPLWNFIWHDSAGHRLQGFGYGAFWLTERTLSANDNLQWFPGHSHSAYLQTIVNLGFVGLAILLAIALLALNRAARLLNQTGLSEYRAFVAILVAGFVNGATESAFAMPRDMGLFAAAVVFSLAVATPQFSLNPEKNLTTSADYQLSSRRRNGLSFPTRRLGYWSKS